MSVAALAAAQPSILYLRDGEVVLYRRSRSLLYQCRYRLADGTWHRVSTRKASVEHAIAVACDLYDEARYRQRLGLAHRTHTVAQIAAVCCAELRTKIDGSTGKTASHDYLSCIERYFVPYFGERRLEQLTHTDVREFELWRDRQMRRKPATSTLNNFTSAWNKLIETAVAHGYISERVPVPKLTARGEKGRTRPAFTEQEVQQLLTFMDVWQTQGRMDVEKEIRPLLRDYIELLLLTGMRHGTEAMNICWQHIEWHTHKDVRYIRIWVDGKTGGRWLIAKHRAVDVLLRLQQRQVDIKHLTLDAVLSTRVTHKIFRFSNGYHPHSFVGTCRRL
ncbi:integrase, partial [Limnohabitans sp. Rim8]|uniref:integrase n=1 Tax=Limnohabitans sp. Rim8 TaxID=1100718 RepID=UPI0025D4E5B4